MLTLPFNASREIFQFFSFCCSCQAKITSQEFFLYVRNSLHSCIYLSFFLIFEGRVTASLFFASEHRQAVAVVNVIVARKRQPATRGKSVFSPKDLRKEKIPIQIIFISIKAFKRYVARFFKALSITKVNRYRK